MIDTGEIRKGLTIELDGNLYTVVDWEHNKTGRGGAVVRLKLRDLRAGHIFERTWPAGSKFQRARVERQNAQYLYNDGDLYYFMNTESYEQIPMSKDRVGDMTLYLKENEACQVLTYGDEAISVELPAAVVLEVVDASGQPMTIAGVRSTLADDLYVVLVNWEDVSAAQAPFKVYHNPLINWLWIGSLMFIFGFLVAAWPEREEEKGANNK